MEYPNWFEPYARPMFEKHLLPHAGTPGLRFLQIGAFTGDASVWMLGNVLTGRVSWLEDVDTWEGSDEPEHEPLDWDDVELTYLNRVHPYADHLVIFKIPSEDYWPAATDMTFDFVYIDGDHTPAAVLSDGVHAYERLKPGGLLAFDDYQWTSHKTGVGPGVAVDAIAECYRGRLDLIELGAQAWFRKSA